MTLIVSGILIILGIIILCIALVMGQRVTNNDPSQHIMTVYDRGAETVFVSNAKTVGEALELADITIDDRDMVEPALDEELVASNYWINIYRSRPVVVVDGTQRIKTVTPYQTVQQIADDVGVPLYDGDITELGQSTDFVGSGAGLQLTIMRATPIHLDLYGRMIDLRTQGKTVREMLKDLGVQFTGKDRVSVDLSTPIVADMHVRVWREGKQVVSVDEPIGFGTKQIYDADRYVDYRAVTSQGANGNRSISYEIEIKDGVEISRTEIARVTTTEPIQQVETIGIKSYPGALSQSKGAQQWADSRGVVHRETYYDLDMGVVMKACGQGGRYSIRVDGVKIDADGYAIIAANLGRYPRCSVVETSVGRAKVYDTGGFALRHPEGFDIATDWSNNNGR